MTLDFGKGLQLVEPPESHLYHSIDHLTAVAKETKSPGGLCYPKGVAIDPATNLIYVAEGGYKFGRVSIFSESGEYLNSSTHEHMNYLYGIAILRNNVYVTDWMVHGVFRLKMEADFRLVAKQGSKGSGIGQFNFPCQLSISTSGDVYIADRDNDRIQILDCSLQPIREIAHPSMHGPFDVKLTTEEIYVLCPDDSPCVHVFTHSGHKIRSLLTRGRGMQVTIPLFFCFDTKKNLIISDVGSDQIKIFSNGGALLHTIGERGHQSGMFDYPQGLALTSNLNLVTVSWNKNYRLQIFSSL